MSVIYDEETLSVGKQALEHRRKFNVPILAIGGSNGKTTTKDMISNILRSKYNVLATAGNANNHLGVPRTLLHLDNTHDMVVLEFGTNHFGELEYLCNIVEPTHVLITNVGKEHLEFFKTSDGAGEEETELFRYVIKNDGWAFLNLSDTFLSSFRDKLNKNVTYGAEKSHLEAVNVVGNSTGTYDFDILDSVKKEIFHIKLSSLGIHNVNNALAAASVGRYFDVPVENIQHMLNQFRATPMRLNRIESNGFTILNDTYNSNTESVFVALDVLNSIHTTGKKVIILGDMLELGESSEQEHINVGAKLRGMNFKNLITIGKFSKYTNEVSNITNAKHFDAKEDLIEYIKKLIVSGDIILVKGSRGMKMEEIVESILYMN